MTDIQVLVDKKEIDRALDRLMALLSPEGMTVFFGTTIAPYLTQRARERFQDEGDDVTGAWLPLKEVTKRMRVEQGFAEGPINRRTGELEDWVTGGTYFAYPTVDGTSMRFPRDRPTGELKKKVETAQRGRKNRPVTPARPVLGLNERDLLFYQTALSLAVEGALR